MAAKKPDETPAEPEVVAEPEPVKVPRGAVVRSKIHLDDSADSGRYYRPGDEITGWTKERIAAMVAAGIAEIV